VDHRTLHHPDNLHHPSCKAGSSQYFNEAENLYTRFVDRGRLSRLVKRVLSLPSQLDVLPTYSQRQDSGSQHTSRVRSVHLDRVTGTESKLSDFDRQFRPLNERTRQRWVRVAAARLAGLELPAVELVKVGEAYFVRDGHHRVSVARAMGESYIEAVVLEAGRGM
jgi:hypothetical protein